MPHFLRIYYILRTQLSVYNNLYYYDCHRSIFSYTPILYCSEKQLIRGIFWFSF